MWWLEHFLFLLPSQPSKKWNKQHISSNRDNKLDWWCFHNCILYGLISITYSHRFLFVSHYRIPCGLLDNANEIYHTWFSRYWIEAYLSWIIVSVFVMYLTSRSSKDNLFSYCYWNLGMLLWIKFSYPNYYPIRH